MLAYITHPDCMEHDTGHLHPDQAERCARLLVKRISGKDDRHIIHLRPGLRRPDSANSHYVSVVFRFISSLPNRYTVRLIDRSVKFAGNLMNMMKITEEHQPFCEVPVH